MLCICSGLVQSRVFFTAAEGCQSPSISVSLAVIMWVGTGGCMGCLCISEVLIYMLNPSTSEVGLYVRVLTEG